MNIEQKVLDILCELSGMEKIESGHSLQEDLGLDSLLMVTLLMELEESLDIELDEADMNPFELVTVDDVIKLAERYCEV